MSIWLRAGPFKVSSRGRVGVSAGPISAYGGGRRRRSSSSDGTWLGVLIVLIIVALVFFAIFVAPAALIGHLFGFTPSVGQVLRHHPPGWMHAHYPEVGLRFAAVDLALAAAIAGICVAVARRASSTNGWRVRYDCADGSSVLGATYYANQQDAALAAAGHDHVTLSGTNRPVRGYAVVLDPARDPDLKKRQRAQAADTSKAHAYCPKCHRRFFARQKHCMCGHSLGAGWEQQFASKTGCLPEARPQGQPSLEPPLNLRSQRRSSGGVSSAPRINATSQGTPVQEAAHERHLVSQLRELAALHKNGDLSKDEFESAKARLISG